MPDQWPLPERSRLIHIGPFKTGSTGIQWALHVSRDEIEEQGVTYTSGARHNAAAARHLTDTFLPGMDEVVAKKRYERVVEQMVADTGNRKVYSSEYLCNATTAQIETLLDDIGRENTYFVVTLRPLAKILSSQYQQFIQGGATFEYEKWLDSILNQPPYSPPSPNFWRRHRHDELVKRWVDVAGADRVIAVMLDSADYGVGPRAFEEMLGLTSGTLADKEVPINRSMTWSETEMLRQFNGQYKDAGIAPALYRDLVKSTMAHVKERRPGRDEVSIVTPPWAIDRANEIGAEMAAGIRETGITVVGDLALMANAKPSSAEPTPPTTIDVAVAGRFAMGFALVAQKASTQAKKAQPEGEAKPKAAKQKVAKQKVAKQAPPPAPVGVVRRVASRGRRAVSRLRRS